MDTKSHPVSVTLRDPADLRLHALQKQLPEPDKQSPEWLSFVEGMMAAGPEGIPPLVVTREGLIMDGGRRWRAAKQLQWEQVPTIERPEHEAAALIVDSLLGQRNLPRGTKVYLTLTLLPDFVKSAEHRRLENLKRGLKNGAKPLIFPKPSDSASGTVTEFCVRLGVSRDTYEQAVKLHKILHDENCAELLKFYKGKQPAKPELLAKQAELRAKFEPDLLTGEKSLWNVISAIAGHITTNDVPLAEQMEFWTSPFSALKRNANKWDSLTKPARALLLNAWKETAETMPADLRRQMAAVLEEIE
jgi:hypothetical protein